MATFLEWESEVKKLSDKELEKKVLALVDLRPWEFFYKEFSWTGLGTLEFILNQEIKRRAKERKETIV